MKKISVIIPIYNVEAYLRDCVDSVLTQDYADLEIILVDDGSPDSCGSICDEYGRKDPRIRVIHKENGGQSDARNAGAAAASGEFVMFLDADDLWSDPGALTRLMARQMQTGTDVLNFSCVLWFEQTGKKRPYFKDAVSMPELRTKAEQLDYLTAHGLYIASSWNKLIRRELLEGLEFRRGVCSEDIEWCAELMVRAGSMDFVRENFYLYRQHPASVRHTINEKKCEDLASNILACFELAQTCDARTKEALLRYTAFQYGTFFAVQAQAERVPQECFDRLKNFSWILSSHGGNRKLRILNWGCRILGFQNLCRVIRLIYR